MFSKKFVNIVCKLINTIFAILSMFRQIVAQ